METSLTQKIFEKAKQLGFDACGISAISTSDLEIEKSRIKKWISKGNDGSMKYLSDNIEKRTNPALLLKNAKSIISLLINYYPHEKQNSKSYYHISKYAYGKDYHVVIKNKTNQLVDFIRQNMNSGNFVSYVDAGAVLEKYWAAKSGLGFVGKNSLLINKHYGSFCFISEILTDVELDYTPSVSDNPCANCNQCIKACPMGAIENPYSINATKCIAYLTIEAKELIVAKTYRWIYGCDVCQNVCPWNKKPIPSKESAFKGNAELLAMEKNDWEKLDNEKFNQLFSESAIKRIGFEKLKQNLKQG